MSTLSQEITMSTQETICQLNNLVTSIRSKREGYEDYIIPPRIPTDNGEDDTVQSLLPHWKKFVDAIRSSNNRDNQFWSFDKAHLSTEMINILQPLLLTRNILKLKVNNDGNDMNENYAEEMYNLVCEVIEKNTTVKYLTLTHAFRFGSRLFTALENNQSLEEVHLIFMQLGSREVLSSIFNACKNLKYLDLNGSNLGRDGGDMIATSVKSNPGLEHLCLLQTGVTNDDAVQISEALQSNTNLRVLSMVNIGWRGRKAMCNVLFNGSTLDTVAKSNHSCFVQSASRICKYEALLDILNRKGNPKDNRKWKVLSVLYATKGEGIGEEFKCYQNLKLIPEMLAFISADCSGSESSSASSEMIQEFGDEDDDASNNSDVSMGSIDNISVESDESFDSYDSLMDDLDDFDDDDDEVYENFDKSFLDPTFCGEPARLTILFQVIKLWGLPLLDKMPPLSVKGKRPKKTRLAR